MDEAQYLADRVSVIAGGRVVAEGTPSTLGFRDRAAARLRYRLHDGATPPDGLGGTPGSDGFIEVGVNDAVSDVHRLLSWAIEERVDLEGFEVRRPSLEDVYLALTNSPSSGGGGVR
jgi:ABC-2 type transport system ATP-binding protein